ncbi:MAG: hypothetical protein KBB70_01550 [Candidatus Pacebacteria bacterium]|nr:hypothetical protein [Candidatus Paceibacterota bacterium]
MKLTTKIQFCFPEAKSKTKEEFITFIMRPIRSDGDSGYAGFEKKKELTEYLSEKYVKKNLSVYQMLSPKVESDIEKNIIETVKKCQKLLGSSAQPISVFVFPWFQEKNDTAFDGVNGFAPYENTIHLFIDIRKFTFESLRETVAHELNHATFFHFNHEEQTLLDTMIFEGFAEHFREAVVGGKISAWAGALSEKKAKDLFTKLKPTLLSKDFSLYREVFLLGKKYPRWTGYSIGYRIVGLYLKSHKEIKWQDIIKMAPVAIFSESGY